MKPRWLVLLMLGAAAVEAARPWPIFKRSYISATAGPAVEFELSASRRWYGTLGDTVPGTAWTVQAMRFMPSGVWLIDRNERAACVLLENHSPWYEPRTRLGSLPDSPRPSEAQPEPPPRPRTAAWYAELARQYAFIGRSSESTLFENRASELRRAGDRSEPVVQPRVVERLPDLDALLAARREDGTEQDEAARERDRNRRSSGEDERAAANLTAPPGVPFVPGADRAPAASGNAPGNFASNAVGNGPGPAAGSVPSARAPSFTQAGSAPAGGSSPLGAPVASRSSGGSSAAPTPGVVASSSAATTAASFSTPAPGAVSPASGGTGAASSSTPAPGTFASAGGGSAVVNSAPAPSVASTPSFSSGGGTGRT